MKSKIKRHSRSVISVVLALCMLLSCMTAGIIMTDAAKIDSESVGYSGAKVKGSWDSWTLHDITGSTYSVNLNANSTYSFVFTAENGDQFSSNATISGTTDYNFPRNNNDAITLRTAAAGYYTFSYTGYDGGQTSMSVHIEFPASTGSTTWTAVGDSTALFGSTWAPTATANDMTKSGTTWSKTWNGVSLTNGSTIKYKVAKDHAWTTTYPSDNATATVPGTSGTGLYNVTVTYNESGNAVNMEFANASTYTLTVGSVSNAVVKATYNGTTANEGGTLSGIPAGASVTISVTPDAGYSLNSITSNPSATISGSGNTRTLTMPSANVTSLTVNLNDETATLKRVYFYNVNTEYAMVSAYVDYNGSKPLGVYPGSTMTRLNNSNVWYVDVPGGATDITFIGDNGYNTGSGNRRSVYR